MIIDEAYIKELIIPRNSSSHKGENGTIGIIGGSKLYHGAPLLSALGALRSGSDLAYLFVPEVIANPIRAAAPDIVVYPLPDSKFTMGVSNKILNFRKEINTFVIGPGIVNQKMKGLVNLVSKLQDKDARIILDAGAINSELINNISGKNIIVTAHLGEFARLIDKKIDDDESIINEIANYARDKKITLIVKGKTDFISDGEQTFLNKSGNEKNTVNRIGAKTKRPTPGANSIPYDAVKTYEIGLVKINPPISEPRAAGVLSSGWIYLKVPLNGFTSLNTK